MREVPILFYLLIPVFGIAALLSGSRTGMVIIVFTTIYIIGFSQTLSSRVKIFLLLVPLLLLSAMLVYSIAPTPLARALDIPISDIFLTGPDIGNDNNIDQRVILVRSAWEIFSDYPIIGIGLGGFSEFFMRYFSFQNKALVTHNIFFNSLAETGLLGILSLLLIYFAFFQMLIRAKIKASLPSERQLIDFVLMLLIGFNVINASLHGSILDRNMFIFFGLAAASVNILRRPKEQSSERVP